MLNILEKKQNISNKKSLNYYNIHKNINKDKYIIQYNQNMDEYKNMIYYPSSSKEWFNSVYSFNKSYIRPLVVTSIVLRDLLSGYFNMLDSKIKVIYKRRRTNKIRYSANKVFLSRPELKHTNTKFISILYTFNKQKLSIERYIRILLTLSNKKHSKTKIENMSIIGNRLMFILKKNFYYFSKWNNTFLKKTNNVLKYKTPSINKINLYISLYNTIYLKRSLKFEHIFFNYARFINFNKSKLNNLILNLKGLGVMALVQKLFYKNAEIKLVEQKSIHLNSDVFSHSIALKLRDRMNRPLAVLRRAILQMVKIPDLHTLITFDERITNMNKDNVIHVIKQQVVSGVRFEASGRLTRRLTAMRAVFKYRYTGSLKNIRSSFNTTPSTILRGHALSNLQYTIINSKTRNGAFALKTWMSSH